jgi:hypothetical protein
MADEQEVQQQEQQEPDFESMSLEQLREHAIAEGVLERPRDAQGRFVSTKEEEPAPEVVAPPAPPQVFRREIDLGDGSGKQVFEAESMDALLDKLTDAQTHATRKIRELSQQKKEEPPPPPPAPETAELTEDQRWLISQEFLTDPDKAFDKLVELRLLPKLAPKLAKIEAIERQEQAEVASNKFVETHPEYHATPKNGEKLVRYLNTWKMDATVENLEKAFQELNESGLLEAKPAPAAENGNPEPDTERIARPGETIRSTHKVASGLSARRSTPPPPPGPTEDELYKLPLEELHRLALNAALNRE